MTIKDILILLFFVFYLCPTAFSQSINEIRNKKSRAEKEILYLNKLLDNAQKDKTVSIGKVKIIQEKISQSKNLLYSLNKEVEFIESDIRRNEERIKILESEKKSMLDLYAKLVYGTWKKRNQSDKLMFILSSSDFNQAYNRFKYFQQIQEYSRQQLFAIKKLNDSLDVRNQELKSLSIEKNQKLSLINSKNQELELAKTKENQYIIQLKKKEQNLKNKLKREMQVRQRLSQELNRLITRQTKKSSVSGSNGKLTPEQQLISDDFAKNKGRLPWPVAEGFISEKFGVSVHSVHKYLKISNDGIDITTSKNEEVRAVFKGIVLDVCFVPGLNYTILIQHGKYFTAYPNLLEIKVKKGDKVSTKQILGRVGFDNEKGSVLNFQIWEGNGKSQPIKLNPELWLAK